MEIIYCILLRGFIPYFFSTPYALMENHKTFIATITKRNWLHEASATTLPIARCFLINMQRKKT